MNFGDFNAWCELIRPYGYPDVRFQYMAGLHGPPFSVDLSVIVSADVDTSKLTHATARTHMMERANAAIAAVETGGFVLDDAPDVRIGGRIRGRYWSVDGKLPIPGVLVPTCEVRMTVRNPQ